MKTYSSILLLLASANAAYGHSSKSEKEEISSMSFNLLVSAKSGKGAKKEPIRRVLADESEMRNLHSSSESMAYVLFSGKSGKSTETKSSKARRFLDVEGSEDLSMSMVASIVSGKSTKIRTNGAVKSSAKSAKNSEKASSSDEQVSSSNDEKTASSSDEVDAKGKSSKASKASVLRFIAPSDSEDNVPLKSLSAIEYSNAISEESNGAMAFDSVAALFATALPLVSAVFMY